MVEEVFAVAAGTAADIQDGCVRGQVGEEEGIERTDVCVQRVFGEGLRGLVVVFECFVHAVYSPYFIKNERILYDVVHLELRYYIRYHHFSCIESSSLERVAFLPVLYPYNENACSRHLCLQISLRRFCGFSNHHNA